MPNPTRTCVGCRVREAKSGLLRVVAGEVSGHNSLTPDPRGVQPGRGAYVHPSARCLDLAERRRAFSRALRSTGSYEFDVLRGWIAAWEAKRDVDSSTVDDESKPYGIGTAPEPTVLAESRSRQR